MAIIRKLRCELTEPELRTKGKELANTLSGHRKLKVDAKNAASTARAAIKELEERIQGLTRDYQEQSEERQVGCKEERNIQSGKISLVRLDTGETIERREMTAEERQGKLPGVTVAGAKPTGKKKTKAKASSKRRTRSTK